MADLGLQVFTGHMFALVLLYQLCIKGMCPSQNCANQNVIAQKCWLQYVFMLIILYLTFFHILAYALAIKN